MPGSQSQSLRWWHAEWHMCVCPSSLPSGGWMKMERSFFLKKRRADFVSGYLKGRVVVAGGLGEELSTEQGGICRHLYAMEEPKSHCHK